MEFLQIDKIDEEFLDKIDLSIDFEKFYQIMREKMAKSTDTREKLKAV